MRIMENNVNIKLLSMAGQGGAAFGVGLMEIMLRRGDIMVLSSDMSTPAGLDKFKNTYPDSFLNLGIAEQNMLGVAAGLAEEGFKAICVAQACFLSMRSFEQIRQYCGYMQIPVVIVGIGSGFSLQQMGPTHYALEDIALMRSIPNMTVFAPCDALEAKKALETAVEQTGPVYIRLFGGVGTPSVHREDIDFAPGKSILLRQGGDVAIIAAGSMVKQAVDAAAALSEKGIECSVADAYSLQPFDESVIGQTAGKKLAVTIEEHHGFGGLGSIVAERINSSQTKLLRLAVGDGILKPGSYPYMLKQAGLDSESIANKIIE